MTLSGKSVGVLYEEVRLDWDKLNLVSQSGKVLIYPVTLQTKLGDIVLELHPEWAPNHVRSSSGCAARISDAPVALESLASLRL